MITSSKFFSKGVLRDCLQNESRALVDFFTSNEFSQINDDVQNGILADLIEVLSERSKSKRLQFIYDPIKTTWQTIYNFLEMAQEKGKEGKVAQYLVGATLALRFSSANIQNLSYSTADDQLERPGDFYLGNTVFHVTVAPTLPVFEKCKKNLEQGYRAYLLVPDRTLAGARQNASVAADGKIAVESIESFVGNNVEELSEFSKDRLRDGFRKLLQKYNQRVDAIETDKSLLIEIPPNLL